MHTFVTRSSLKIHSVMETCVDITILLRSVQNDVSETKYIFICVSEKNHCLSTFNFKDF